MVPNVFFNMIRVNPLLNMTIETITKLSLIWGCFQWLFHMNGGAEISSAQKDKQVLPFGYLTSSGTLPNL